MVTRANTPESRPKINPESSDAQRAETLIASIIARTLRKKDLDSDQVTEQIKHKLRHAINKKNPNYFETGYILALLDNPTMLNARIQRTKKAKKKKQQ